MQLKKKSSKRRLSSEYGPEAPIQCLFGSLHKANTIKANGNNMSLLKHHKRQLSQYFEDLKESRRLARTLLMAEHAAMYKRLLEEIPINGPPDWSEVEKRTMKHWESLFFMEKAALNRLQRMLIDKAQLSEFAPLKKLETASQLKKVDDELYDALNLIESRLAKVLKNVSEMPSSLKNEIKHTPLKLFLLNKQKEESEELADEQEGQRVSNMPKAKRRKSTPRRKSSTPRRKSSTSRRKSSTSRRKSSTSRRKSSTRRSLLGQLRRFFRNL